MEPAPLTPASSQNNRLAQEKSPYLLQHAENPVDWRPWSEEAFAQARAENKPIFLSIGYSTCHWCHVMAHESFEDRATAEIMNREFVNIKVDREERPDVQAIGRDHPGTRDRREAAGGQRGRSWQPKRRHGGVGRRLLVRVW